MATKRKTTTRKSSTKKPSPLAAINTRIRKAKADLKAGKTGASQRLDKAITAKCKYNLKKGQASCRR